MKILFVICLVFVSKGFGQSRKYPSSSSYLDSYQFPDRNQPPRSFDFNSGSFSFNRYKDQFSTQEGSGSNPDHWRGYESGTRFDPFDQDEGSGEELESNDCMG